MPIESLGKHDRWMNSCTHKEMEQKKQEQKRKKKKNRMLTKTKENASLDINQLNY